MHRCRLYWVIAIWVSATLILFLDIAPAAPPAQLFKIPPDPARYSAESETPIVLRRRVVTPNFELFAGGNTPDRMELNLFNDTRLFVTLTGTELGDDGGLAWLGRLEGHADSQVTIVVRDHRMSAMITLPQRRFDLRPWQDGLHIIQELDSAALPSHTMASERQAHSSSLMVRGNVMNAQELRVLELVNDERAKNGRNPLTPDDRLTQAARGHSQDMADHDYFSHTGLNGSSPGDRITAAGYIWNYCGENIAMGYSSPEAVVNGWMNSSGHRSNILNANFCDLGVGYVSQGPHWTQNFGRLSGVSQCPADSSGGDGSSDGGGGGGGSSGGGGGGGCFVGTLRALPGKK